MSGIVWAIKTGDLSGVKDAVEKDKANVNEVEASFRKSTPLHSAADFGHTDVIEYLLSKGANINAKDSFGNTPLLCAVYEGHVEATQLLVSKGASTKDKGPDGKTALEAASSDAIRNILNGAKN
eukprot:TRINITY_DN9759_c0_g1_i1.p1 TRINITY_DN9759_c0_g1~~TRINITY_DN9759_c0_g1_i1.p1  ORF type:complete len:124 (-),score=62.63 TRINITY_DN9759_c0_g1_i1:128-499(-)